MSKTRIQYVDAMRGFTMLLVVVSHVSVFCLGLYGSNTFSYGNILSEFRMPLFFFVSGFVFYKSNFVWNNVNSLSFLKKKIGVQVIFPLIFLFASAYTRNLQIDDMITDYQKGGYWFTFVLLEYFIIYILLQYLLKITNRGRLSENV